MSYNTTPHEDYRNLPISIRKQQIFENCKKILDFRSNQNWRPIPECAKKIYDLSLGDLQMVSQCIDEYMENHISTGSENRRAGYFIYEEVSRCRPIPPDRDYHHDLDEPRSADTHWAESSMESTRFNKTVSRLNTSIERLTDLIEKANSKRLMY